MKINKFLIKIIVNYNLKIYSVSIFVLFSLLLSFFRSNPVLGQTEENNIFNNYQVVVNSNLDGEITPDEYLTLREAIAIINNILPWENLSEAEKAQVTLLENNQISRIEFNLNESETTIKLTDLLPPVAHAVIIDGTTNAGYDRNNYTFAEKNIPQPVVAITPAENTQIFRGLTLVADNITVKGLSIYGFSLDNQTTLVTPPGDIVIAHQLTPAEFQQELSNYERTRKSRIDNNFRDPLGLSYHDNRYKPTQNIVIENNWLGISPNQDFSAFKSAFGVYIFNSINTRIDNNYITAHQGSGIITGRNAENTLISNNIITANGMEGMPDAIRLEGKITNSHIHNNLICGNDGSGVYLYRPQGNVTIAENLIKFNGRRIRSSGIHLMDHNHQVHDNKIEYQTGPGIVVAGYPQSDRNILKNNQFSNLEGLSIDLDTQRNVGEYEMRLGNGINPPRNSKNRRKETGNAAINAPQFLSNEFFIINNKVGIDGIADPNSLISIYQVTESNGNYGPLNKPLVEIIADENGRFSTDLNLQPGDVISAIATLPEYGTSEPAQNAIALTLNRQVNPPTVNPVNIPTCTTSPIIPELEPTIPPIGGLESGSTEFPPEVDPESEPTAEVINLRVPRNVHFALDKSHLTPESQQVLDQIASVLRQYPFMVIELVGHTDSRASVDYNLRLGQRRGNSVRNYLLSQGIDPARMTIRSLGKSQLKKPGNSILDHAYNRRVEVIFKDVRNLELIIEDQDNDLQLEKKVLRN
jgi:outer membrane protein OmpA-like peptidoglycan-associated protein